MHFPHGCNAKNAVSHGCAIPKIRLFDRQQSRTGTKKLQGRDMDEKAEPSVWYVASIAICIFTAAMLLSGVFGGSETTVAIAAQQ